MQSLRNLEAGSNLQLIDLAFLVILEFGDVLLELSTVLIRSGLFILGALDSLFQLFDRLLQRIYLGTDLCKGNECDESQAPESHRRRNKTRTLVALLPSS